MSGHLKSVGAGVVALIVGLVLWQTTQQVHTPVVSLNKIGVVVAFVGGLEVVVSGTALLLPSARKGSTSG